MRLRFSLTTGLSRTQLLNPHIPALIKLKIIYAFLRDIFHSTTSSPLATISLFPRQMYRWAPFFVQPVQTITARTHPTTSKTSNHPNFSCIHNLNSIQTAFVRELMLYGTDPHMDTSLNTKVLTSLNKGLTGIYPHNVHFVPPSLLFILYISFIITF